LLISEVNAEIKQDASETANFASVLPPGELDENSAAINDKFIRCILMYYSFGACTVHEIHRGGV